jgi:hypothetical protein
MAKLLYPWESYWLSWQLTHFSKCRLSTNCPAYNISAQTTHKTPSLCCCFQLLPCKHACLRSCYSVTAVVFFHISQSLPSNGSTVHNTFLHGETHVEVYIFLVFHTVLAPLWRSILLQVVICVILYNRSDDYIVSLFCVLCKPPFFIIAHTTLCNSILLLDNGAWIVCCCLWVNSASILLIYYFFLCIKFSFWNSFISLYLAERRRDSGLCVLFNIIMVFLLYLFHVLILGQTNTTSRAL